MEKLTYTEQNGFLVPDLTMDEMPEQTQLGRFGKLREKYLMEHRKGLYSSMLMTGKLWTHLTEIDRTAGERVNRMVSEMAAAQGMNEALKERDPMAWVGAMNSLKAQAEEIVLNELVYA